MDLTGNDYVSIPFIDTDGSMDGINVLVGGAAALVEWAGDTDAPLLRLNLKLGEERVRIGDARWRRLDRWIPTFTATLDDGSTVAGTICAPAGYPGARGFLVRIDVESRGRTPRELEAELQVGWTWSRRRVESAQPLPGRNLARDADQVLVLATDDGRGPALAIGTAGARISAEGGEPQPGGGTAAPNGTRLDARVAARTPVASGSRASIVFWVGAGRDQDGAVAAARALRRHGPDHWLRQARLELSHTLRAAQDHRWAELLNRNLLFNRYYAIGRGIDDDRIYLLRSRSPRCPGGGTFSEREALLWTLPALMVADPGLAREALFRVFELMSDRSGEHLRYLDGGSFDNAFVLDHFLLYAWAAHHYAAQTGDGSVLEDGFVRQIVQETDSAAFMRLHPQHLLAATELLPSGDRADHPYATMANALLWVFCEQLGGLTPAEGETPPRFQGASAEVAASIWHHCVTDVGGHPVLASSSSLEGDVAIYDDPAFSLALLPFLGFCGDDDPVWRATMDFLRSPRYPLWREGRIAGLADRSSPDIARTAALCADLLTPAAASALERLLQLDFPAGVTPAGWNPADGEPVEPDHAALAGFLAWTLVRVAEPRTARQSTRRKGRR